MQNAKIKDEVWQAVQDMNQAWTKIPDEQKIREYFHKDMVSIVPTARDRISGGDACVAGWMGFANSTNITHWEEKEPLISIFLNDTVAVVSYYFDMAFEMNGNNITMSGRDLFTLINENGRWKVVSDQFSQFPF
ncbi:MAG: nuclear transport factor 2 family protein [Bacteroidota bacterium]